jgi:hypothetical protein
MSELLKKFDEFKQQKKEKQEENPEKVIPTVPKQKKEPKPKAQPVVPSWVNSNKWRVLWVCLQFEEFDYDQITPSVQKVFPHIPSTSIDRYVRFLRNEGYLKEIEHRGGIFRPTSKAKTKQ